MKNLALFVATVAGYFGIWWYFGGAPEGFSGYAMRLGILALLSAPFNVKGTIWTVLGNAESEKSIYSLFSLYQKAGQHAFMFCGVAFYQRAGAQTETPYGLAVIQTVGRGIGASAQSKVRCFGGFWEFF